jgi:hypothetical protein
MVLFNPNLVAKIPLSLKDRLGNPDFQLPISVIFGDQDWVKDVDGGASLKLV